MHAEAAAVRGRDQDGGHPQAQRDFDMFLIGWFADYPDPFDFINVLLDGRQHPGGEQLELRVPEQPEVQQAMTDAAKLSGEARYDGVRASSTST